MHAVQNDSTKNYIQKNHEIDTIFVRDSIFVKEYLRGDTVYLTRTEYRDRWRTRVVHDTVQHTEYVDRVVEKTPERYIPKFHKWCTGLFLAISILLISYCVLRYWILN